MYLEPVVCNKTSHHNEKPARNSEDSAQPTVSKLINNNKRHLFTHSTGYITHGLPGLVLCSSHTEDRDRAVETQGSC